MVFVLLMSHLFITDLGGHFRDNIIKQNTSTKDANHSLKFQYFELILEILNSKISFILKQELHDFRDY